MSVPKPPPVYFKELDERGKIIHLWPLADDTSFFLGRGANNNIILPYQWISRKHAMVRVEEDGTHTIIDLGSSNGTFVNCKKISTPTRLRPKDIVRVGKTNLSFYQENPDFPATLPEDLTADRTMAFWQREMITILICDMHKFTTLSEALDNQTLSDILKFWSSRVSKVVRNHQGIVDKFIGDAVLAIWVGRPDINQTVTQALHAALEINYFTRSLNKEVFDLPWELSVGGAINTGEAVLGNTGSNGLRDFTAIGDAVNVAFRLEDLTSQEEGRDIIIGENTARHYSGIIDNFSSCQYCVKGKKQPITSFYCSFDQLENFLSSTTQE